jgi:hypothetical protein
MDSDSMTESPQELSSGFKYDDNKIRMELLPLRELQEVAKVLTYGAKKYAPDNWKKVPNAKERYAGALLRHFTEYREGNIFDHEACPDILRHIAQVACNALFLLYFELQDEISKGRDIPYEFVSVENVEKKNEYL